MTVAQIDNVAAAGAASNMMVSTSPNCASRKRTCADSDERVDGGCAKG